MDLREGALGNEDFIKGRDRKGRLREGNIISR